MESYSFLMLIVAQQLVVLIYKAVKLMDRILKIGIK